MITGTAARRCFAAGWVRGGAESADVRLVRPWWATTSMDASRAVHLSLRQLPQRHGAAVCAFSSFFCTAVNRNAAPRRPPPKLRRRGNKSELLARGRVAPLPIM
jgi:hypothetical protein